MAEANDRHSYEIRELRRWREEFAEAYQRETVRRLLWEREVTARVEVIEANQARVIPVVDGLAEAARETTRAAKELRERGRRRLTAAEKVAVVGLGLPTFVGSVIALARTAGLIG